MSTRHIVWTAFNILQHFIISSVYLRIIHYGKGKKLKTEMEEIAQPFLPFLFFLSGTYQGSGGDNGSEANMGG